MQRIVLFLILTLVAAGCFPYPATVRHTSAKFELQLMCSRSAITDQRVLVTLSDAYAPLADVLYTGLRAAGATPVIAESAAWNVRDPAHDYRLKVVVREDYEIRVDLVLVDARTGQIRANGEGSAWYYNGSGYYDWRWDYGRGSYPYGWYYFDPPYRYTRHNILRLRADAMRVAGLRAFSRAFACGLRRVV